MFGAKFCFDIYVLFFITTFPSEKKYAWFDFADELKIGDVRYKHLTK